MIGYPIQEREGHRLGVGDPYVSPQFDDDHVTETSAPIWESFASGSLELSWYGALGLTAKE